MQEAKYVVALHEAAGVGPKTFRLLMERFGSPQAVFDASVDELTQLPRIGASKASEILRAADRLEEIEQHLLFLTDSGVDVLTLLDGGYPKRLRQIDDAPPLLYIKGHLKEEDDLSVSVVGSHQATFEGVQVATKLGQALAERGVTVVSGLALGIDTASHRGALQGGGRTMAVLGSGLNFIHPKQNLELAEEISLNGALISEYPMNAPVNVGRLMARNRVVTGLSGAVIVVEATLNSSGTMDAAVKAKSQGRPVYAVRWQDCAEKVESSAKLIANGGIPIKDERDIDTIVKAI